MILSVGFVLKQLLEVNNISKVPRLGFKYKNVKLLIFVPFCFIKLRLFFFH